MKWARSALSVAVLLLTFTAQSSGAFVESYAAWEKLPSSAQVAYTAATFDMRIYSSSPRAAEHQLKCIQKDGLNSSKLTDRIKAFAKSNSNYREGSFQNLFSAYLVSLCGDAD